MKTMQSHVDLENADPEIQAKSFSLDRRSLLVGGALVAGAAYSQFQRPVANARPIAAKSFEALIPNKFEEWQSRKSAELVLPQEDEERDKLYENLQTRIYEKEGGPSFMTLFGYNTKQQNDVQVHRPEVCYPASGFPIIHNELLTLNFGTGDIHARYLIADRKVAHEYIVYWVRLGRRFPADWQSQRLDMAYYNIRGIIPDGFLYRCSTINQIGEDMRGPLKDFSKRFLASSSSSLQKIMI
jgi:EpsI family protein